MCIEATLRTFSEAWGQKDIERIIGCFAHDGTYFSSVGPLPGARATGPDDIRALVETIVDYDAAVMSHVYNIQVCGDRATWQWRYEREDGEIELGCDLFTFTGNLIAVKDAYRKTKDDR